jgi:hypothetical protein
MAEDFLQGKNIEFVARDIADGYVFVNPIYMKRFTPDLTKKLLAAINKSMVMIRNERFPTGDIDGIKRRNMRLSRLNNANTIIKHYAKERRWMI